MLGSQQNLYDKWCAIPVAALATLAKARLPEMHDGVRAQIAPFAAAEVCFAKADGDSHDHDEGPSSDDEGPPSLPDGTWPPSDDEEPPSFHDPR